MSAKSSAAPLHGWNVSVPEAREIQQKLAGRVRQRDRPGPVRLIGGADVSYDKHDPRLYAAWVVLDARTRECVDTAGVCIEAPFPYVPGYLSFRELPALLAAWERLRVQPDVAFCDGQGIAHPRRFGLACHLGVWLDLPALGCAKSILVGEARDPGQRRGCHTQLKHGDEVIGEAVRTRDGVKPVYVSVGHHISLPTARRLVLGMARGLRIPEPTRLAHHEVNRLRRAEL